MNSRSEREREWIEEHDRLSRLFKEDRLIFERERKVRIDRAIGRSRSTSGKIRLRELQKHWDSILKHAGSEHNRFVLIQMLFWDQVRESWYPAMNCYENKLREAFIFP